MRGGRVGSRGRCEMDQAMMKQLEWERRRHAQLYMHATANVLSRTKGKGLMAKFKRGVPFRWAGHANVGSQCVTVSIQISDDDLEIVRGLGERFALQSGSHFTRVYRDRSIVRIEYTLPVDQWLEVPFGGLPLRRENATIGQLVLGRAALVDWTHPHKAIFGSTQTGKTTCLTDFIISLAKIHRPDDYRFLIINPKNDPKLAKFSRLSHLMAPMSTGYEDSAALLRYAVTQMVKRQEDPGSRWPRLVVFADEIAQLTMVQPEVGPLITQLSQMGGGLKINLVAASQAANPSVFGSSGSLAKANFASRLVFQLPHDQAYMATGMKGQHPELLGGKGDGLGIVNGKVTRFRAALPSDSDLDSLSWLETEPAAPTDEELAGDAAVSSYELPVSLCRVAYSLIMEPNSATAIRRKFGGGTDNARVVRDVANDFGVCLDYWAKVKRRRIQENKGGPNDGCPIIEGVKS